MSNTKIQWTNKTWNPVTGCSKVSAGCKFCYAETLAKRFWGNRKFTEVQFHEDRLTQPTYWKKPAMIFVNSMSDLFHESLSFHYVAKIFQIMKSNPRHIFQILTKRPQRALAYFQEAGNENMYSIAPNIWIGVSVENQEMADLRIPVLLQMPVKIKFLSCEPLLGKIDLCKIKHLTGLGYKTINCLAGCEWFDDIDGKDYSTYAGNLDWVIVGGESGHGARPMNPEWVRLIQNQCKNANVPFFFKQGSAANWKHYKNFETMPDEFRVREFPEVNQLKIFA